MSLKVYKLNTVIVKNQFELDILAKGLNFLITSKHCRIKILLLVSKMQ